MANTPISIDRITKEIAVQLSNELKARECITVVPFEGAVAGKNENIQVKLPVDYVVTDGPTMEVQDTIQKSMTLKIDKQKHVAMQFTAQDLAIYDYTLEFRERFISPAVQRIANQIDRDIFDVAAGIYNATGTIGTAPNSYATFTSPQVLLDETAVPEDNRSFVLDAQAYNDAATFIFTNTGTTAAASTMAFENKVPKLGKHPVMQSNNLRKQTYGTCVNATGAAVRGANQSVAFIDVTNNQWYQTLSTDGWTSTGTTITQGEIINIAGVFSVNRDNKTSTGILQDFVVMSTATTNANALNETEIVISPPIIVSGPYQTVSNVPADDAVITFPTGRTASATRREGLLLHKNSIVFTSVGLESGLSKNGNPNVSTVSSDGITVMLSKDFDIINGPMERYRLDVLYGTRLVSPWGGCRLFM
jgi:hypothetical protein